jgi:ribulose-5-phosphate 4-epimerase/fuculose-1-phosphate aldolase
MKKITAKQFTTFIAACHRAAREHDLMRCSSGNISSRVDSERMLVTGTRTWLGTLRKNQVAVVRIRDGALLSGCKPSAETPFHAGVLRVRTDVNVVLHFQTPFATMLACCDGAEKTNFFLIPEIPYYIGEIAFVPFLQPGSEALGNAVTDSLRTHDMVVLRNHGAVTVGKTFDDAIQKAVFFELACQIVVQAGEKLRAMPTKDSDLLQRESGRGV